MRRKEKKRVDEEWRRIEHMRRREENRAEKEWRYQCYDLKLKVLSNRTTFVLSNTRELDRVPSTK